MKIVRESVEVRIIKKEKKPAKTKQDLGLFEKIIKNIKVKQNEN